eukprot:jgi/Tetstr1/436770/TSEL_025550.t1
MGHAHLRPAGSLAAVAALLVLLAPLCSRALEVRIADVTRTSFIDELQDTKYVIAMRTHREVAKLAPDADAGSTPLVMSDKAGQQYRCFLPPISGEGDGENSGSSEQGGGSGTSKPPSAYLAGLASTCFYRVEGWWTYELCYKKRIRQYHQDHETITSEFVLGNFDEVSSEKLELAVAEGAPESSAYFAQRYGSGTPCDLTGTPRETEVRYVCSADSANVVSSIKEPSTCSYVLTFQTPLLCKHPAFRKKVVAATPIYCNPLFPPPEGDDDDEAEVEKGEEGEGEEYEGEGESGAGAAGGEDTFESSGGTYKISYADGQPRVQMVAHAEAAGAKAQGEAQGEVGGGAEAGAGSDLNRLPPRPGPTPQRGAAEAEGEVEGEGEGEAEEDGEATARTGGRDEL